MKVQTSPYERAINRLAQGTPKDCDLADELEQACRAAMKERLSVAAAVAAEQAKYGRELQQALTRISNLEAEKALAVAAEREACARDLEASRYENSDVMAHIIRARGVK